VEKGDRVATGRCELCTLSSVQPLVTFLVTSSNNVLFCFMSYVVHIVQVKVPLKLRLKLIAMMSLSIHMMTSQGRMCVQCVRNGLDRSHI